jgi:PAS domain S-box-containing protein
LQTTSNRLRVATRAAKIGIWDFDPVNNVLIWDDQMFEVFGVTRDRFSGAYEAWESTLHPDDVLSEREKVERSLRGEGEFDTEFRIIWPDKSIHYIKAKAAVQRDASGRAVHMIGANWDITDQKVTAENLIHTVEDLARSNADLEQFAYVASHDLQEPLRAVAGCVGLIEKGYHDRLDARANELILHAVEGAKRMQALIQDLLAYARVGTQAKAFEQTDSNGALDRALANLSSAIRESGARITRDVLPQLTAEPTQLTQLLQNLISNSLKFCAGRRPEIHVSARPKDGGWVFAVKDNGIGIGPEYRDRIFVIFQRLHTRTEYAGTGIGLAICKRIVDRHGGQIWVESEPGKGATFYFTIPGRNKIAP